MVWAPLWFLRHNGNQQSGRLVGCADDAPMALACLPIDACSRPVAVRWGWVSYRRGQLGSGRVGGGQRAVCAPCRGASGWWQWISSRGA